MPYIAYEKHRFGDDRKALIGRANEIIEEYRADGLDLTLRQLYYQLVSRDVIPNNIRSYNNLGSTISAARRAGLVDWTMIVDRTRNLRGLSHWDSPADIIDAISRQFRKDLWENQPVLVEVWFEKDALSGIFERAANPLDVPFFSCRGYASDSEVWGAAQRFRAALDAGKEKVVILHFGDHDPSGIDMTRDIEDRIRKFATRKAEDDFALFEDDVDLTAFLDRIEIRRVALNMDQVRQYRPPPNPAKTTDARFRAYAARYGQSSWELDAIDPRNLAALVESNVEGLIEDPGAWSRTSREIREGRSLLAGTSSFWPKVIKLVQREQKKALKPKKKASPKKKTS